MAEIINLGTARKARDRKAREAEATANRALYGRTKAERAAEQAARARTDKTLDGAKRED